MSGNENITIAAVLSKPIVRYRGAAQVVVGRSAILHPVDHPNHLPGHNVSNARQVRTSAVIDFNSETGYIETMNTIYMPETQ